MAQKLHAVTPRGKGATFDLPFPPERMLTEGELRFPSKIDRWLVVLIGVATLGGPVSVYVGSRDKPLPQSTVLILAAGLIIPVALVGWLFSTTEYVISGPDLRVRSGPVRIVVPIGSITRIARSDSLASGATLSLSRLAIEYGAQQEVIISPADRRGFIRAIVERAPNVVLEDLDEYR